MEIKVVDQNLTPVVKESQEIKPKETITGSTSPELEERAIQQALGLENDGDKHKFKHEVDTLLQWAKENAKSASPEDIKWAIRSLELRVGTPPLSEHRARYLARYAYLAGEHKKLERELKSFEAIG